MKYMEALLRLGCFSFDEAIALTGNRATAASMLLYYTKHGAIVQIRKGLYSAINPLDKEPVASPYLIGTKLTESAVISHHSAFEYHGYANQVFYQIFVSSESKFNTFEFGGHIYRRMPTNIKVGIETTTRGERITDLERTVLDSINDFEKAMGFEELIQCISVIPVLNERRLLSYLEAYDKCFLYQKVGFIFEHFRENFDFSDEFFRVCKERSGNSSRYLLKEMRDQSMDFSNKWRLTYPKNLWNNLSGGDIDADI